MMVNTQRTKLLKQVVVQKGQIMDLEDVKEIAIWASKNKISVNLILLNFVDALQTVYLYVAKYYNSTPIMGMVYIDPSPSLTLMKMLLVTLPSIYLLKIVP